MKSILVTGANGQLGQCFQKHSYKFPGFKFLFCTSKELDITSKDDLKSFFRDHKIEYCINTAAYTNVEESEKNRDLAFLVNAEGARNLAEVCKSNSTILFHFSTDYVFDGESERPYVETDKVNPINVYGTSKLKGEKEVISINPESFVFRTSWLYSEFGHNFFRTILSKADEKAELNITTSQKGTPTNANDLAEYVLKVIASGSVKYGIYHFSNEGEGTWYDFAKEILEYSKKRDQVVLNKTGFFKTLATRPKYSVLSKEKATRSFGPIKGWKESLHQLMDEIS